MAEKILVVDDERHIVRLVEVNLQREGFEVVVAYNGEEALAQVETEKPDLVVLDVMMPVMDGFEVLKKMELNDQIDEIPIIMLTAKAQDGDVFKGWASGVSAYLTKPFNPQELLSFVKRLLIAYKDEEDGLFGEDSNGGKIFDV